jgi:micrococcal nuclease
MSLYHYRAYVLAVIDGDTVRLDIDLGCHVRRTETVRLMGINAPELHGVVDPEPGKRAKQFLETTLLAKHVRIQTFRDRTEKYGRLLAEIFQESKDAPGGFLQPSVNSTMVAKGFAVAYAGGRRS